MTQADSALALRRSLDSDPTTGQGQAQALPQGWGSFRSKNDHTPEKPHWYAVSPFAVEALKAEFGREAYGLLHTVHAKTWEGLRTEVFKQVALYRRLTGDTR